MISANADAIFNKAASPVIIEAQLHTQTTKLFVSENMFQLAVALRILYILTAFAYYLFRPAKFLNRMPLNVATVVSYVAASHALNDFACEGVDARDETYGFGRFIGRDGRTYIGVEKMSHISPEEPTGIITRVQGFVRDVVNMGRRT
jgi:hypothetical protein